MTKVPKSVVRPFPSLRKMGRVDVTNVETNGEKEVDWSGIAAINTDVDRQEVCSV